MPQRPGVAARIPEGHIPELHLILPVRPFFGGQAALVHGVGQVQKLKGQPQEHPVGPDVAQRLQSQRDAAEQLGGGPHILGHRPHIEGSGPGFQADIQIHHPGKQRRKRLGQPLQQPHPTPGQAGDGGAGGEAVLPHIAAADVFLLAVDAQIGGAGQLDRHEAKKAEISVALPHGSGLLAQQQVGPAAQALESSTVITMAASTPAMHSGLFSTASGLCAGTLVKNKVRVKPTPASTCTAAWQNSI